MTYANPEALVSTDWLTEHLDDPAVRVIEVDEDISLFGEGHIPGATAWSWTDDLHHSVRRDYIDKEGVSSLLEAAGVREGSTVVLYGGNDNWFAAYAAVDRAATCEPVHRAQGSNSGLRVRR